MHGKTIIRTEATLGVAIPTYNRSFLLEKCLASLYAQTLERYDVYILDNCSTDSTSDVVKAFQENAKHLNVQYLRHQVNLGPESNFRLAYKLLAGHKYGFVLADDDWISSNFLEAGHKFLDSHPDYGYYYASCFAVTKSMNEPVFSADESKSYSSDDPSLRMIQYSRDVMQNHVFYSLFRLPHHPKTSRAIGSDHFDVMCRLARRKVYCDNSASITKDCTSFSTTSSIESSDLRVARMLYLNDVSPTYLGHHIEIKLYDFYINALQAGILLMPDDKLVQFVSSYLHRFFPFLDRKTKIDILLSQSKKRYALGIIQSILPCEIIETYAPKLITY